MKRLESGDLEELIDFARLQVKNNGTSYSTVNARIRWQRILAWLEERLVEDIRK